MNIAMDSQTATERFELIMNSAIRYNNPEFIKSFKSNPDYFDELLNYYEKIENFERCFWIYEVKKSFILGLERPNELHNNLDFSNDFEYYNLKFKLIMLDIIYYRSNEHGKRFKSYGFTNVGELISFFESIEDFEKCYWLNEIKQYFETDEINSLFLLDIL
jgi:hypothetical protein